MGKPKGPGNGTESLQEYLNVMPNTFARHVAPKLTPNASFNFGPFVLTKRDPLPEERVVISHKVQTVIEVQLAGNPTPELFCATTLKKLKSAIAMTTGQEGDEDTAQTVQEKPRRPKVNKYAKPQETQPEAD